MAGFGGGGGLESGGRAFEWAIRPYEEFQQDLRKRQKTPDGRAEFRERVAVEHGLARISQTKGVRARYRGLAKNQFDLDRHATVSNCYVLDAMWRQVA